MWCLGNFEIFPRVVGAGGVILNLEGNLKLLFSWNIGHATNNQADAYALIQGSQLARQ